MICRKFSLAIGAFLFSQALSFSSFAMDTNDKDAEAPDSPRRTAVLSRLGALQKEIDHQDKPALKARFLELCSSLQAFNIKYPVQTGSLSVAADAAPKEETDDGPTKPEAATVRATLLETLWHGNFHKYEAKFKDITDGSFFFCPMGRLRSFPLLAMIENAMKAGVFGKLQQVNFHSFNHRPEIPAIFLMFVKAHRNFVPCLSKITIHTSSDPEYFKTSLNTKKFLELVKELNIEIEVIKASPENLGLYVKLDLESCASSYKVSEGTYAMDSSVVQVPLDAYKRRFEL